MTVTDFALPDKKKNSCHRLIQNRCRRVGLSPSYPNTTKDIAYWIGNLAPAFRDGVAKLAPLCGKPAPAQLVT